MESSPISFVGGKSAELNTWKRALLSLLVLQSRLNYHFSSLKKSKSSSLVRLLAPCILVYFHQATNSYRQSHFLLESYQDKYTLLDLRLGSSSDWKVGSNKQTISNLSKTKFRGFFVLNNILRNTRGIL